MFILSQRFKTRPPSWSVNELEFKTGLIDFSQKVGKDSDRVPANIITTEEYNESYDKNFLVSKPSKSEKGKNNTHITVKPLSLIEHLIKLFSKKGSLVVDPFLGSGTTALGCKNTNRKCIGIELNAEYYQVCLDRLAWSIEIYCSICSLVSSISLFSIILSNFFGIGNFVKVSINI